MAWLLKHISPSDFVQLPRVESTTALARTMQERASRLADAGDRRSALILLDNIARNAAETHERIRALLCAAEVEALEHRFSQAHSALESAAILMQREPAASHKVTSLLAMHEAVKLRCSMIESGPQKAAEAIRRSQAFPAAPESIFLLVVQAEIMHGCGNARASLAFLLRALSLVQVFPDIDAALQVDLALLQTQLSRWLGASGSDANANMKHVASIARASGYEGRAYVAELLCLIDNWYSTRDQRDRREFRAGFDRATGSLRMPKNTRFQIYFAAADIEGAIGDPWRSAQAARNARDLAPNRLNALHMDSLLARALVRGGRVDSGERAAVAVMGDPLGPNAGRALLYAKCVLADAAMTKGQLNRAMQQLRDAADLARFFGTAGMAANLVQKWTGLAKHVAAGL